MDPSFPRDQCVEAKNIDFTKGQLGATRGGSDTVSLAGGTAFGSGIRTLCRHVPNGDEGEAELWGIDGTGVVKRLRNGTNWADITLVDPIITDWDKVVGVSFNGKLFLFYRSNYNRLHVFDPLLNVVRRVGINPGTASPTVANGGGAGALTGSRYYRCRFLQMNGLICIRKSEPTGISALFSPGGANAAAVVTRPTAPGENETHWELEISTSATGPWSVVAGIDSGAPIDIVRTFYNDTTTTAGIASLEVSDPSGMYTLFPSMRYGISDNNRLMGCGSWDTASEPHESRVWLSPQLGSDDRGDDERWVNQDDLKTRIDTSEKNGGSITSIVGPVNGAFWTCKYRQVWRHLPTGDLKTPYLTRQISTVVGSINHKGSFVAEDVDGAPAGFFTSHRGLYRVGVESLAYMGRDIEDVWQGDDSKGYDGINLSATIPCHALFDGDAAMIYLWVATGTSDYPNTRVRCDVKQATRKDRYGIRGGWAVDTGDGATAYCSAMFANTLGPSMSKDLRPYIGRPDTTVYRCNSDTATTDNGVAFQSYLVSATLVPADRMTSLFSVTGGVIAAKASGSDIRLTLVGDYGANEKVSDISLAAKKAETIVIRKFGASMQSEQGSIQVKLGDAVAIASTWSLQAITIPVSEDGPK